MKGTQHHQTFLLAAQMPTHAAMGTDKRRTRRERRRNQIAAMRARRPRIIQSPCPKFRVGNANGSHFGPQGVVGYDGDTLLDGLPFAGRQFHVLHLVAGGMEGRGFGDFAFLFAF